MKVLKSISINILINIKILNNGIHLFSNGNGIYNNFTLSLNNREIYVIKARVKNMPECIIHSINPLSKTEYVYSDMIECFKAD